MHSSLTYHPLPLSLLLPLRSFFFLSCIHHQDTYHALQRLSAHSSLPIIATRCSRSAPIPLPHIEIRKKFGCGCEGSDFCSPTEVPLVLPSFVARQGQTRGKQREHSCHSFIHPSILFALILSPTLPFCHFHPSYISSLIFPDG